MELGGLEILAGLVLLIFTLGYCYYYRYLTSNFDFWKVRNVPGPRPIPIAGNYKDVYLGKIHASLQLARYYEEYKNEPLIGIFLKNNPVLIVKDPDLIKDVLIKDFNVFCDRGMFLPKKDQFNQNIVNLEYKSWKPLRSKMSSVFSSGKIKDMFYLMAECAQQFEEYVEKLTERDEDTECKELAVRFTIQVIGTCIFGLDTNSLSDKDSEFLKYGKDMFANTTIFVIRNLLQDLTPSIYEFLGPLMRSRAIGFLYKIMMDSIAYRKENKVKKNDFIDILMDLQDKSGKIGDFEFNDNFLTGQALVFFGAGFETSAITMTNAFYELALNQDVQDKLRQDIRMELDKNDGKLTYEIVNQMTYLDKVFKETLRKYPLGNNLQRKASSTYTFKGTNVTIPKDTLVFIPVWAIHRDPDIYPNPEKFDPLRFDNLDDSKKDQNFYLPFGEGPHNCIGMRFANYETKVGIITMVNKFKLDVCDKTCMSYRIEPRQQVSTPVGGIYLKISKL